MAMGKGQPLKLLKPGFKEKILEAAAKGASYTIICKYAKCCRDQLNKWIRLGEEQHDKGVEYGEGDIYHNFYVELKAAEAEHDCECLEKINMATDWKSSAWHLERKYRDDYGDKAKELDEEVKKNTEELKTIRELILKNVCDSTAR